MYDGSNVSPEATGLAAAFTGFTLLLGLGLYLLIGISYWKIFEKADKPGWAGFVPIYNTIVLLEIIGRPVWWIVLLLIPCVNIIYLFIINIDLAKSFGKDAGFGVGLSLLGIIFYPMLGFGSAEYQGPVASQQ